MIHHLADRRMLLSTFVSAGLFAAPAAVADTLTLSGRVDTTLGADAFTLEFDEDSGDFRFVSDGVFPLSFARQGDRVIERDWHGARRTLVGAELEVATHVVGLLTGDPDTSAFRAQSETVFQIGPETAVTTFEITGKFDRPERLSVTDPSGQTRTYIVTDRSRDGEPLDAELPGGSSVSFDPAAPQTIDVRRTRSRHALVEVTVNGRDLGAWIFDSGAGGTVINASAAKSLGLEPVGSTPVNGVGGRTSGDLFNPDSLTIGPMTIESPRVVAMDLGFLSGAFGEPIAGIIGYDVLAQSVATIVPGGDSITIAPAAPQAADVGAARWVELATPGRIPTVRAEFEGVEAWFRLDTGAASHTLAIHEPAVRRRGLLEGRETTPGQAAGVGGAVKIERGRAESFTLAGETWTDLPTGFATEPVGAFADPYSDGNIGGVVLSRFDMLIFDYAGGRLGFVIAD